MNSPIEQPVAKLLRDRAGRYRQEQFTAAIGLAVMAVYVVFGNWRELRVVALLVAIVRLNAWFRLGKHRRWIEAALPDAQLATLHEAAERDIEFIESNFRWYAIPLAVGLTGFAAAVWRETRSYWVPSILLGLSAALVAGTLRMNRQTIATIRATLGAGSVGGLPLEKGNHHA